MARERLASGRDPFGRESGAFEITRDEFRDVRIVLDDDDTFAHGTILADGSVERSIAFRSALARISVA